MMDPLQLIGLAIYSLAAFIVLGFYYVILIHPPVSPGEQETSTSEATPTVAATDGGTEQVPAAEADTDASTDADSASDETDTEPTESIDTGQFIFGEDRNQSPA